MPLAGCSAGSPGRCNYVVPIFPVSIPNSCRPTKKVDCLVFFGIGAMKEIFRQSLPLNGNAPAKGGLVALFRRAVSPDAGGVPGWRPPPGGRPVGA
ncbi:hypothetical protein [Sphaerisporangium rufum]|uniref:hypothetical protein n=1 Tax=Sphaerisporangium rufum TaxID=1381558 RepID=UPI00194E4762|nr:hypothetical protein [Sphaerisporangium rufum]